MTLRIHRLAYRLCVEGPHEELLAAGVLRPGDPVPSRPRGFLKRDYNYWCSTGYEVSMLASGELRVRGRGIELARFDQGFQRFMTRALEWPPRRRRS